MIEVEQQRRRSYLRRCRILAVVSAAAAAFYMKWLLVDARPENLAFFYLLLAAELFNVTQCAGFWYTISVQKWSEPPTPDFAHSTEKIDVFITVCGEPADIVQKTIAAARVMRHPRLRVWVLDDGPSDTIAGLARRYGVRYLTRDGREGAKAGNMNAALARTHGDFIVIFDADHVPRPDFLERTMGAFADPKIAFVQTPQSYRNRHTNGVAAGAHDQQSLFYGPILRGKNGCGAVFSCGTNVVFRRSALDELGGFPEDSITEDLRVSLMLMQRGYTSLYVPTVLAHGLGPNNVAGYFSQQMRWARGGLEIFFRKRPFFLGMSLPQMIQYFLSFIYWFTGWAYVGYLILPMVFLVTGVRPVQVPNQYPVHFLPYVLTALFTLAYASGFQVRFRGLWFTLGAFPIHVGALLSTFFGRTAEFVVTPKGASDRTLRPVFIHIALAILLTECIIIGLLFWGITPSVLNNVAWAIGHILILQGFGWLALEPSLHVRAEGRLLRDRRLPPPSHVVTPVETSGRD